MQVQAKVTAKKRHMKDRTDNCRWKRTGADKHAQVVASHKPASSILHAVIHQFAVVVEFAFYKASSEPPCHRASHPQGFPCSEGFPATGLP